MMNCAIAEGTPHRVASSAIPPATEDSKYISQSQHCNRVVTRLSNYRTTMPVPSFDQPIVIHEATGHFLSPDTTITTRTDFTKFFLNFRSTPDAHPLYKHLFDAHQT